MSDLREIERASIRAFVQSAAEDGYLSGRVLDYGCGKQPYRDIVEDAGGAYHGWDRADLPANVGGKNYGQEEWYQEDYESILCTQVVQYIPMAGTWTLADDMAEWRNVLSHAQGYLVLTYPTNWPEVEVEDLHRFTKAGMERLLTLAGFEIIRHQSRTIAGVTLDGENLIAGYGVIARA